MFYIHVQEENDWKEAYSALSYCNVNKKNRKCNHLHEKILFSKNWNSHEAWNSMKFINGDKT